MRLGLVEGIDCAALTRALALPTILATIGASAEQIVTKKGG